MTGPEMQKLHEVLLAAFDQDDLRQMVKFDLDVNLDAVVGPGPPASRVFDLIQHLDGQGRLAELIEAAARARPKRPDMQAFFRRYAGGVAMAARPPADAAAAYDRLYAGKPPVDIQAGGVVEAAEVSARDPGLGVTIRRDAGFLNAAVWAERLGQMERRVCRVELDGPGGLSTATGFLVGPDAVLTVGHFLMPVIAGELSATGLRFRFDYRQSEGGQSSEGVVVPPADPGAADRPWLLSHSLPSPAELRGEEGATVAADELDYALVRLARPMGAEPSAAGGGQRGWIVVPDAPPRVDALSPLMILQHPTGRPVKLAVDTDPHAELTDDGRRLRYRVSTEPGSSGAPVFDRDWNLVAMHHYRRSQEYRQGIPAWQIRGHLPPAGLAALGARADTAARLIVSAAVVDALSEGLRQGVVTTPDRAADVAARGAAGSLSGSGPVAKLTKRVRDVVDRKLDAADRKLSDEMDASDDPIDWQKATDRFKQLVCALLRQVKELEGELPDDWVQLWVKYRCG